MMQANVYTKRTTAPRGLPSDLFCEGADGALLLSHKPKSETFEPHGHGLAHKMAISKGAFQKNPFSDTWLRGGTKYSGEAAVRRRDAIEEEEQDKRELQPSVKGGPIQCGVIQEEKKHMTHPESSKSDKFQGGGCSMSQPPFLVCRGSPFRRKLLWRDLFFQGSKVIVPHIVKAKTRSGGEPSIHTKLNDKMMLKELLKLWGADPHSFYEVNEAKQTVLHVALQKAVAPDMLLQLFLIFPKACGMKDAYGRYPLRYLACHLGEIHMKYEIRRCDELLMDVLQMVYTTYPPAIAETDSRYQTPLDSAISEGAPDCFIKVLQTYAASFYKKHHQPAL
jgi:hypothetical protein